MAASRHTPQHDGAAVAITIPLNQQPRQALMLNRDTVGIRGIAKPWKNGN